MLIGVLRPFAMAAKIEGLANIGEAIVLRRARRFVVAHLFENCSESRVRSRF